VLRHGKRRRSSELRTLFAQLGDARRGLQHASGELEAQFLATSSELETLAGYGDQFVKQVQKLVGLATGKECHGTVFSDAIQLIERSTQFLAGCQTKTDEMLGLLQNYKVQVEQLLGVEAELQRTMLPLQFVQILFRVESAQLNPEIQQMFGSLTQEIEGLHGQVREIFGTKFKQLEQTQATIGQVIGQLARQSQSLQQVMANQKVQIESSLELMKKEMISNAERDSHLGQLSKDMAREVGQIVMGLQFQDIISQKLQHVNGAMPVIEAKFADFNAAANLTATCEPLQFLQQSCRLEAGQVLAAQAELAKAETAIQGGIQKVLSHLKEMDSHSMSLQEFKLLTTSFDGMVQVLVEMIEEVRRLVAATVASATEAFEMLQPLGTLASDLTLVVHDISARIHLIGLNAQVQAARAAQDNLGTALEVLSARTSEISTETNRISQQAAAQLDAVIAGLAGTVAAFGQLRSDGLTQQNLLDQRGCAEEKQLHAFRDNALETLQTIGTLVDKIKEQAQRALATVKFDDFHQVTLPALQTSLEAIADAAERWLRSQCCGAAKTSLIESFQRDYTMASERKVFAEVTSGNPSLPPLLVSPQQNADPDQLFVNLPTNPDVKLLSPGEPESQTVPLPEESAPAGGAGLGANAELF
jgi:hypothetical protein